MLKKKVCFLGSFGVGKTSLIRRYVLNVFSEAYLSTVGVKIDKKIIQVNKETELTLLLWDLENRDNIRDMSESYLAGMSAYFLVADGTREDSIDFVYQAGEWLRPLYREVPAVLLLNKVDLRDKWVITDRDLQGARFVDKTILHTSAKTGAGVEDAFLVIAEKILEASPCVLR